MTISPRKRRPKRKSKRQYATFYTCEFPDSAFSLPDKEDRVGKVYGFFWQQSASGPFNQGAIH